MGRELWGGWGGRGRGGEACGNQGFSTPLLQAFLEPCCVIMFLHPDTWNPLCKLEGLPHSTAVRKPESPTFGFPENLAGEILGGVGVGGNLHG